MIILFFNNYRCKSMISINRNIIVSLYSSLYYHLDRLKLELLPFFVLNSSQFIRKR